LPALSRSALAAPAGDAALTEAVRAGSLLALVVARGELWRITAHAGRLQVTSLGRLAMLQASLARFRAVPGDREAAAALGAVLVPVEQGGPSDRVLHVVLDEPLAWLPVEALRVGDRALGAARPIVRAARASALGCVQRSREPRPVIRLEARSASRASLSAGSRSARLHIAVPIEHAALGDAFVLGDDRVGALELAGQGGAAAQLILESSAAGAAGTSRLAMALVAAGAEQVIATVRPVSSAALARLAERLERGDGGDLPRALAQIQRAAADDELLGVAAFGRATCDAEP
jgi:hypothetical protein